MKTYQYILLDWDGNLAKTLDVWLDARRITLEKRGLLLTDEEIAASFGALDEHLDIWGVKDPNAAGAEMDALAKKGLPDVELYPGVLRVLEALRAGGKQMALITTSPHEFIAHLLDKHNLRQFFGTIVAGDDVTHHKPHPEPLEKALAMLGGDKAHAIMIGDSDKDLGAAANAGIDSILFHSAEHEKFYKLEALQKLKPTYIVDDFRKVLELVD